MRQKQMVNIGDSHSGRKITPEQSKIEIKEYQRPDKNQQLSKGFKLDLEHISKQGQVGFH